MAVKLKTRRPVEDQEEKLVKDTVSVVIKAIVDGEFDTHLPALFEAIDNRIRAYQQEEGDSEPERDRAGKLRTMRSEAMELVPGRHYRLRGTKYANVVVMFLETVGQANGDAPKAKVEAINGNDTVGAGKVYIVPAAALEDIPEIKKAPAGPVRREYRQCRKCGENIEYSGKGRPKSLCSLCEYHKS